MGTLFTVGHSTRTTGQLIEILRGAGVGILIDVRRFPASRQHPHFSKEALEASMSEAGIDYEWWGEELGGRRSRKKTGSRHGAWRNASFQGYADYMDTSEFRTALERLEALTNEKPPPAVMCAETLWWRCHRRLIADAVTMHGIEVVHLFGDDKQDPHRSNPSARRGEDGYPVYDVGVTEELAF